MPNQRQRLYWDANVWLSYINAIPDRLPVLDASLADSASSNGSIELCTSALSQVEVAYGRLEQDKFALDPGVEGKIDKLWADRNAVKVVEYHDGIGAEARQLIRMAIPKGWSLKPLDAIHLATAKWFKAAEFQTYDTRLLKFSNELGLPILQPHAQQGRLL
ncbi:MAG: PIN domain-containing protein [Chloroflexi bacterium]|nr:PIN domain-containing protein [Chloroflexota bacterium]